MKSKENQKHKLNYKNLIIFSITMLILIVAIIVIIINSSKDKTLKLEDFEKIGVYNYLEKDLLDVSTLYRLSGKETYNEIQVFQSKLKRALDTYFASNSGNEVSTSEIISLIDSEFIPSELDFHGIIVSDYNYIPEKDAFVKAPGANANIAGMEAEIDSIDYSDKKTSIQNIEKTSDNKYRVTFNILDSFTDNSVTEASGEVILSIKNNDYNIDSCTINE